MLPRQNLVFTCRDPSVPAWNDGMPLVFNFPLAAAPAPSAIQLELSDGSVASPACVMLPPANEQNELDTLLLLGQFGDGEADTLRPVKISVVEDFTLVGPDGPVSALGLTYSNEEDFNYVTSTVRLTGAKLWDALDNPEDFPPPRGSAYPNDCSSLYPSTSHVMRATFSGGVTTNGVTSILPNNTNVFRLSSPSSDMLSYLGLADLGQTPGDALVDAGDYVQDGDNYVDICLDLTDNLDVLTGDITLKVLCDPTLENSVLYPPKGKPHGCSPEEVVLSTDVNFENIIMSWTV